jgi:hypothetical protein
MQNARKSMRLTAALATLAFSAAAAISATASAAVIVTQTTPYDISPATAPGGYAVKNAVAANVYDFAFNLLSTADTLMQMQGSTGAGPQLISFSLFSGAPSSGSLIAGSGGTPTAASLDEILTAGAYYLQADSISAPNELISGAVTPSAVPEPAVWGLMITGFGGLGLMARRQRRSGAVAA